MREMQRRPAKLPARRKSCVNLVVVSVLSESSEARRALAHYVEGALQGQGSAGQGAFVEQTANKRDAVGDAARGREFRQRATWIGGPVAAGLGDLDETCAHCEGRVTGEISDGEHFVMQRRDEQNVHLKQN